jgi:hypothetical protein
VFFGICDSCNQGCDGMTFFTNSVHYPDFFIESKDSETLDDFYETILERYKPLQTF